MAIVYNEYEQDELEFNLTSREETLSNPIGLAEHITFGNSHDVAYHLFHSDPAAAQALMNELLYWVVGKKSDG